MKITHFWTCCSRKTIKVNVLTATPLCDVDYFPITAPPLSVLFPT